MSLKAKLEAVIYAAEEPVTLAQLAALFAADALEWKAEQEAAAAADGTEAPEPAPLLGEDLEYLGLEQTPAVYASQAEAAPAEASGSDSATEAATEAAPASEAEQAEVAAEPAAAPDATLDPEAEAKRLARQRDREVKAILRQLLDELIANYASDSRGVEIREIAGGYRMATKPECHDAVRMFIKSLKPPMKLSLPALETLAVIAYKQPVTAPEVNEIRGVESGGVLGSLLSRKLIATAGRKQVIGRPILYKTTKEFLLRFGLKDLAELPSMEEFEKMAAMELNEAPDETDSGYEPSPDAGPELDENAPEDPEDESAITGVPAEEAPESSEFAPVATAVDAEQATVEAVPAEPPAAQRAETETPHND
ncbi:MAG: SMC-Scp complex subunit ScpB [Acidobacteriota bacterium]|nr:SMC-Scp complex subunit ScpB [Acidobacteriota bacterium]